MNVVIVGSNGRIGSALARRFALQPDFAVLGLDRAALPLDDVAQIGRRLQGRRFDLLINAAAITNVDICEENPAAARQINAEAPAALAAVCREQGARMIHLSTDYVFDGRETGWRVEEEVARPMGQYGRSKLGGEIKVVQAGPANLVVRTSWVFGSRRPSFPDMILDQARQGRVVSAIDDKWSCPCYNEDFAQWMEILARRPEIGGVLHLCNGGECTWQEYAQAVLDIAVDLGVEINKREVQATALAAMTRFVAPRPIHSSMSTARFTRLTGHTPRPWRAALRAYLEAKLIQP